PASRIAPVRVELRTHPDRPCRRASRYTKGRNPTPCTVPRTVTEKRSRSPATLPRPSGTGSAPVRGASTDVSAAAGQGLRVIPVTATPSPQSPALGLLPVGHDARPHGDQ